MLSKCHRTSLSHNNTNLFSVSYTLLICHLLRTLARILGTLWQRKQRNQHQQRIPWCVQAYYSCAAERHFFLRFRVHVAVLNSSPAASPMDAASHIISEMVGVTTKTTLRRANGMVVIVARWVVQDRGIGVSPPAPPIARAPPSRCHL